MLTREQVLEQVKAGRGSQCLDGRDYTRLIKFFPVEDWSAFGVEPSSEFDPKRYKAKDWTEAAVREQLAEDLDFGFEKALNKRGLSASFMHSVVNQWLWILEDPLHERADELYEQYGLPFFKAVAVKYALPNMIGFDVGDEHKYSAEAYE